MSEVKQVEGKSKVLMGIINAWSVQPSRCNCAAATYLAAVHTETSIT